MKLNSLNGIGEVLVQQAGCEAWPCGEEICVYGLVPGINDRTKSYLMNELYHGWECSHLISTVCEHVCLEGSVGQLGHCVQYLVASCW